MDGSQSGEDDDEDDLEAPKDAEAAKDAPGATVLRLSLGPEAVGDRADRALAAAAAAQAPGLALSRSRVAALIEDGRITLADGRGRRATLRDGSAKVKAATEAELTLPAPRPTRPQPEALALEILFEDAHLVVVVKPAGMATHPAPGAPAGTLVNALLHHCGETLSGIGGELRPGIVHRLDKDTSGVMVAAKSDAAHQGLSAAFARHAIERRYAALAWGAPTAADRRIAGLAGVSAEDGRLRVETGLARHPSDRKRMAVVAGGKRAVTRFRALRRYADDAGREVAARLDCELETGRTHQIRVHAAYLGCGLLGDPVYGRARAASAARLGAPAAAALAALGRQALHAELLGFAHPVTGAALRFERPPPEDFCRLERALAAPQEHDEPSA